jgi:hypothetical protein
VDIIDNVFQQNAIKSFEVYLSDVRKIIPERKPYFGIYADYRIQLLQKGHIFKREINQKSHIERFWHYYQYAKNNNINPQTFWNHPIIDTIINELYIDTTIVDTIQ